MNKTITAMLLVCFVNSFVWAAPALNIVSNSDWKSWGDSIAGWQNIGFDDSTWRNADTGFSYPYSPASLLQEPGTQAVHMWDQRDDLEVFFRYTFNLDAPVTEAVAKLRGDDGFEFYVNGMLADSYTSSPWGYLHTVDIAGYLHEGQNVFAIRAWDIITIDRSMLVDSNVSVVPVPGVLLLMLTGLPMMRWIKKT